MDKEKFRKVYEAFVKNKPKREEKDIPSDVVIKSRKNKSKEK